MPYSVRFILKPSGRDAKWPNLTMRLRSVRETSQENRRRKRSDNGKPEQTTAKLKKFSRSRPAMIKRSPDSC